MPRGTVVDTRNNYTTKSSYSLSLPWDSLSLLLYCLSLLSYSLSLLWYSISLLHALRVPLVGVRAFREHAGPRPHYIHSVHGGLGLGSLPQMTSSSTHTRVMSCSYSLSSTRALLGLDTLRWGR